MAREDVLAQALSYGTPLVELTGGEPLLQAGVLPLMRALCDAGKVVLIETSGERDISHIDPRVHRIVDLKAPGSGETEKVRWENLECLGERDEVKIVLRDRADYDWARDVLSRHALAQKVGEVLLSPVHAVLDPRTLVQWVLDDRLPVRVNLQLHKYVWGQHTQGV
jgi:7-carboxy-7-deazaguanine synthase